MTFPPDLCVISTLLTVHNEGLRSESVRKADGAENAVLIYAGEWNRCGYDFVIMQLSERGERIRRGVGVRVGGWEGGGEE